MDQADRLRAIASHNTVGRSARIISVTSGKGGVGKTNVAVNLSVIFARKGLRVLLIDADFGLANTNLLMGCRIEKSIDDVMFGTAKIHDVFIKTGFGFDLLPSSSGFRKMLELDAFAQRALFDQLHEAMKGYDIVIYDTAPGIGAHVLDFNASAHDIVVLAHPEPTALADAYALIKVLHAERREKHFKLLVNRVRNPEEGLDAFKRLTEVSEEFLNISIDYLGAVPEDLSVQRSVRIQKPVCVDAPRSLFATALDRIGDKLLAAGSTGTIKAPWNNRMMTKGAGELSQ